jgi:hypothetical protein
MINNVEIAEDNILFKNQENQANQENQENLFFKK